MGLGPSRHGLRAANGQSMGSKGTADLELRSPGMSTADKSLIGHPVEVIPGISMPLSVRILGVDFWDRLDPKIRWKDRGVE